MLPELSPAQEKLLINLADPEASADWDKDVSAGELMALAQEIVTLTEDAYEERPWCWVDPGRLPIEATGVHTYNRVGDIEVYDARHELTPAQRR